ncbi:MAG: alkaline phosphatase family protein [Crenarchaeota archaeon]|nr:alkaline phosphatase family protein [Thermoproteota archaeon]MCR8472584.1 alkaline phosphatase family protein [Thermoproteota archaeon]MCR8473579.1 alkaline phosphatase family protein [Thermoproteota archaeon]MCR8489042.1 alkaline phosphatase family protein [Thermoproteota archaeon]
MKNALALVLLVMLLYPAPGFSTHQENFIVIGGEDNTVYGRLAILVVLDALNYTVFKELLDANMLPNFQNLIENGRLVLGKTIYPAATTACWAALFTGAPPGVNGVVNTNAMNSTEYHLLPLDVEPRTIYYSEMVRAESLAEVLLSEGVKCGFLYSESKVLIALGKSGKASVVTYYPPSYNAYDPSLPVIFRRYYIEELINKSINIIDAFSQIIKDGGRALVTVDLPEPDASGHTHGPTSSYYKDVIKAIDSGLGKLVDYLRTSQLWNKTLLIVTTDHSMIQTTPEYNVLTADGKHLVGLPVEHRVIPIGTLVYIYLKHEEHLNIAVEYLKKLDWISGIWTRKPVEGTNGTLSDINLNITYAGDIVVDLKEPYYARIGSTKGDHGGTNTLTIPIIFSGGMYKDSDLPGDIGILDLCPTLAGFLNVRRPSSSEGRNLRIYKNFADVKVSVKPTIAKPNQQITVNITYSMLQFETATLKVRVLNMKTNEEVVSKEMAIEAPNKTETIDIAIGIEGEYLVEAIVFSDGNPLGRSVAKFLVIKELGTPVVVYYALAISITLGVVIMILPIMLRKRLIGGKYA